MGTLRNFLDGQNHQHLTKLNDFWRAEEKSTHNDKFIVTQSRHNDCIYLKHTTQVLL